MKAQINIEKFALDLLDFTEASVPSLRDFKKWADWRGYTFTEQEKKKILKYSEAYVELK